MSVKLQSLTTSFTSTISETWSSPKLGSETISPTNSIPGKSWGGEKFSNKVLEINRIVVDNGEMGSVAWSDLAFALGIRAESETKICREATVFHQKMGRHGKLSRKTIVNNLRPLLVSLLSSNEYLDYQISQEYHRDSARLVESLEDTVLRLPTPRPVFSIGYKSQSFTGVQQEVQQGLVANLEDAPCDLGHLAQPIDGHYWPFFVVEVSDTSVEVAKQACAVSAACCTNAMSILKHSASPAVPYYGSPRKILNADAPRAFSLAIHNKSAVLSMHTFQSESFTMSGIKSYQLDNGVDVLALANRLQSIFVWGMHNRLLQTLELLDDLDRKVNAQCSWQSNGQDMLVMKMASSTPNLLNPEHFSIQRKKSRSGKPRFRLPTRFWRFRLGI